MKLKLLIIFCCATGSASLIILLHMFSFQINQFENGFIRLFPPHILEKPKALYIRDSKYYISGLTTNHIYLGNAAITTSLVVTNYELKGLTTSTINRPNKTDIWGRPRLLVDSGNLYILEGNVPSIKVSKVSDLVSHSLNIPDYSFFSSCFPISQSSFIMRVYDTSLKQNVLIKKGLNQSKTGNYKFIIPKQIEGYFCTDGVLDFNLTSKQVIYTYYYRNQFLCLDTNLNIIHKYKTIDTVSLAKLKIATLSSKNETKSTLAAPPLVVNKRSCINNGLLFINSGLKANNESYNSFSRSSVIDIYILKNGRYKYSFYLPDFGGEKLTDFKILNGKIAVLYPHYIVVYNLSIK